MPVDATQPKLFAVLQGEARRLAARSVADERRLLLSFPPGQVDTIGQVLYTNLQLGGFCTLAVSGRHSWNPHSHYFEMARQAATRGRKITRAFLLPQRQYRTHPALRKHMELDREAGIATKLLVINELLSSSTVPIAGSLDFGIWDETLVCTARRGETGISLPGTVEWRISSRPEDVQRSMDLRDILLSKGQQLLIEGSDESLDLEEPMMSTAPIAEFLSSVLCKGNHVAATDCSWYHSVWQYLRIFNLVSTPTWHASFYFSALERLQDTHQPRILISGTADYSMLAHVLWVMKRKGFTADITVLDLCETPLFLCRWYARSQNVTIATESENILSFESGDPLSCIVTDAFLTRFNPETRHLVVAKWYSLLCSGGLVVTTIRIEEPGDQGVVHATSKQAERFRSRAEREANKWMDFLPATPSEIANRAKVYAQSMVSHPITNQNEIRTLFSSVGFDILHLSIVDTPGEMEPTTYAEIIARRP